MRPVAAAHATSTSTRSTSTSTRTATTSTPTSTPTPTTTSTPTSTAPPKSPKVAAAPPAPRHDDLESRLDAAIDEARSRLAAAQGREGGARAAADLQAVLATAWPPVREALASVGGLVRLLEPPERLDRFGMDPRLVERAAPLVELLYSAWWRVAARGLEHVPAEGPAVIVANHAGLLPWDALVLRHALGRDHPARRELRPLLDDAACDLPIAGSVAIRLGAVRASPEAAARLLEAGTLVGVFPEGSAAEARPWRERYRLGRFGRGGFVKVALRAGAPVIPCAIVGSEEAIPPIARTGWLADLLKLPLLATQPSFRLASAGLLPLPSRWSLRFGPPIELGASGPDGADDPDVVAAATERTRAALQAMLDEDVAARRSVYA